MKKYLWSVHYTWTDDPSNFIGLYEACTAEEAIDMAVQESIRVDPRYPRKAEELRAVLDSKEKE